MTPVRICTHNRIAVCDECWPQTAAPCQGARRADGDCADHPWLRHGHEGPAPKAPESAVSNLLGWLIEHPTNALQRLYELRSLIEAEANAHREEVERLSEALRLKTMLASQLRETRNQAWAERDTLKRDLNAAEAREAEAKRERDAAEAREEKQIHVYYEQIIAVNEEARSLKKALTDLIRDGRAWVMPDTKFSITLLELFDKAEAAAKGDSPR